MVGVGIKGILLASNITNPRRPPWPATTSRQTGSRHGPARRLRRGGDHYGEKSTAPHRPTACALAAWRQMSALRQLPVLLRHRRRISCGSSPPPSRRDRPSTPTTSKTASSAASAASSTSTPPAPPAAGPKATRLASGGARLSPPSRLPGRSGGKGHRRMRQPKFVKSGMPFNLGRELEDGAYDSFISAAAGPASRP